MKPRTVYEKAVQDFTETARRLARLNQRFRQASFAEFEMLMVDDEVLKRYGLSKPMVERALLEAYQNVVLGQQMNVLAARLREADEALAAASFLTVKARVACALVALGELCGEERVQPSSVGGTSRPSALALLRLITNSNLADCTTGSSPGFSPLRMRP